MIAGCDLVGRGLRVHVLRARFGDIVEDGLFVRGESLDGGDQVGNEVGAALQDYVHLSPLGFDIFVEADHLVVAAGVHAAEDEREDDENGDDGESCFHGLPPNEV